MIDRRINIPKNHEGLVTALVDAKENDREGPFASKAAVLAFAAAYGAASSEPLPFTETAGDPIRKSVFVTAGFEPLFNLLAVAHEQDPKILSDTDEMEERRAQIFEGYANRGLGMLAQLSTEPNLTDALLLRLQKNRAPQSNFNAFDITSLLE